jgi:hypothetical protein
MQDLSSTGMNMGRINAYTAREAHRHQLNGG